MEKHSTAKILNVTLLLGIILTFILLLGTPLITTAFFKSSLGILDKYLVYTVSFFVYLCAVPYVLALLKLKKICNLVIKNAPFSQETIASLKSIALCAFSEIILVTISLTFLKFSTGIFPYFTILPVIFLVSLICLAIGLLCSVFAELFANAKELKEENDQTI